MQVKFSRSAVKFLKKLDDTRQERIRAKIALLRTSLEEQEALPADELDLKKLKGDWKSYFRIRVGQIRIIFKIKPEADEILIYSIDFRGSAYDS
ncbi:MAG: type II toxin-antitoxin system RelE/ParE family toxin [Synechococcales cyanobacterium RU_4_20]|nr:type II toxin-antitoxin system RelE/ParE family toxin [Synechococcales cyanobacterium RU_4_20]NJR69924.1 type II toxin-antitoxin system RelE/ParE family toxin [Synechococcales cyanobacterium CRU_2_2]